jgi:hypothetical protein
LPIGRPLRAYLISGLALAVVIAAAALLQSLLGRRATRSPTDFLPTSASVSVNLDVRPEASSLLRWPAEDRRILAERAVQLAQRMVDGTGLQLDLEERASRWFGGQLVVASFAGPHALLLAPRSFAVIARVTDTRRAGSDVDKAVSELAAEAGWERSILRSDGQAVVVWGEPERRSELAYAAIDGCLIVSANSDLVELCLEAAGDAGQRLVDTAEFGDVFRPLPDDSFLWCYATTADLLPAARSLVSVLSEGWVGFVRSYFGHRSRPAERGQRGVEAEVPGRLAIAITAETDGLRVHANYWREPRREVSSRGTEASEIVYFAPPEAAALLLLHRLPDLASLLLPESSSSSAPWGVRRSYPMRVLRSLLAGERVPDSVLLTLVPREDGGRGHALAGAFAGAGSAQAAERVAKLLPDGKSVDLDGSALFASGDEGLRRLQQAAKLPKKRYEIDADVRAFAWARPADVWPAVGWLGEASFTVRDNASGGQAELYLRGEPRHFLGVH